MLNPVWICVSPLAEGSPSPSPGWVSLMDASALLMYTGTNHSSVLFVPVTIFWTGDGKDICCLLLPCQRRAASHTPRPMLPLSLVSPSQGERRAEEIS